jgi:sec-independent protein translocase protein TatB
MLGVGPLELLLIGVVALIVIGPKELPSVMRRVGQFAGTIRRMGQDFQRELNKTTGLNEIKNLRDSVAQPLKATADAIRKEFNTTTPTGEVKPSGAIKPADPKAESVVDEIKAAAGMKPLPLTAAAAAAQKAAEAGEAAPAPAVAKAPVKAAGPARIKAPTEGKVATAEIEPVKPAKKPKAAKPIESPAPVEAIAPTKKPAARKTAAAAATAPVAEAAPAPAKKPVPSRRAKAPATADGTKKPARKRATPKAAS